MCGLVDADEHSRRLIGDLLVWAGVLMEDNCREMISQLPAEHDQVSARIGRLAQLAADLACLAAAASTLLRRHADGQ